MACLLSYSDNYFYYIHLGCAILSIFSSLFIVFFYYFTPQIQNYLYKLITNLAIAQLLSSMNFILPISLLKDTKTLCVLVGFIVNSGQITSIIWMACIAATIYQIILHPAIPYEKYKKYWIVSAWFIVPILNCIPIITDSFVPLGDTCTYNQDHTGTIERICIFFIPVWFFIILTLYFYWKILSQAKILKEISDHSIIIKRLMLYPIIMAINAIILTIARFISLVIGKCDATLIDFFSFILIALNGFINFIIFLSIPNVYKILREKFDKNQMSFSVDSNDDRSFSLMLFESEKIVDA
ncbi:hypothetical protein SteCoe_35456 [Stentor coeruleus]|uniref:G-protein coupled receptors family 2 profile 2 domain-containing protein n=1 Tax=Stentor coeruleus TaxID=5963 RepID=A0A1R2ASM5_9CILI|nr:hypothetical protein SteCoe_35456 [Stentor coeruleus]